MESQTFQASAKAGSREAFLQCCTRSHSQPPAIKTTATCFMAGLIRAEGSCLAFLPPVRVPHNFDAAGLYSVHLASFSRGK